MNDDRLLLLGLCLSLVGVTSSGCATAVEDGANAGSSDPSHVAAAAPGATALPSSAPVALVPQVRLRPDDTPHQTADGLSTKLAAPVAAQPIRRSEPAPRPFTIKPNQVPSAADVHVTSPQMRAKQELYLKQLESLQPRLAGLPEEEQERQRAVLKQATVGN